MSLPLRAFALAALALVSAPSFAQHDLYGSAKPVPGMVVDSGAAPNDAHAMRQHYVVLVSLDGFRYDYPKLHGAPHLEELARNGATAKQGMLPSYPSLTFPNHWTLVTGLYPEHHGIVRNSFFDPARNETYSYKDNKINADGTWYGGVPLWSLAEQQGMRAATFMWPGSEAEVAGHRPAMYAHFRDFMDGHVGLDQVIAWLELPAAERPHLITLYLANTDHAGHWYGPDSDQEREAVHIVDGLMGELRARLDRTGLPVDLIVLADHGMNKSDNNWVQLDQFADLSHSRTQESLLYPESEAETEKVYQQFKAHPDPRFDVYRRKDLPESLHADSNPRNGDPVVVIHSPHIVHAHEGTARVDIGDHGYDPLTTPEMKALFIANGPDIRKGVDLPTFRNVDVYDFIAKLLDLKPAGNDGELAPLKSALKK